MKKLFLAFLAFITSAHLLAPVFEIENRSPNYPVTIKIYGGILDEVQITNTESLAQVVVPSSDREMVSIPDQESVTNHTIFAAYPAASFNSPSPFHIQNTMPTEQISIINTLRGISRRPPDIQLPAPAGQAAVQASADPALLRDEFLEKEFDELFQKQFSSVELFPLTPAEENRLDALKAERARRTELPKRMEELSEKYYTIGLTPEEKAEVRNFRVNLMPTRIASQFYIDVLQGTNELARATQDFILTKAPLQNLTDLQLIKARLHYRKLHDQARLNRDPRNTDPENRAYQISEEMGRRMNKDPKKAAEVAKEFNDIELKLRLAEIPVGEEKKTVKELLKKKITGFNEAISSKLDEITEQIKKQGFNQYFTQHLAKGSNDRKKLESEIQAFTKKFLAAPDNDMVDAHFKAAKVISQVSDTPDYPSSASLRDTYIEEHLPIFLSCLDESCDLPYTTKKEAAAGVTESFKSFLEKIDKLPQETEVEQIKKAYTFELYKILVNIIHDAFADVINKKSPDEGGK